MANKRVVITGMSTINPLGDNLDDYYKNLMAGKSGIIKWHTIDMSMVECKIGGDIGDYDTGAALEKYKDILGEEKYKKVKRLFRSATFANRTAVLTALDAYNQSGLIGVDVDPYRTSIMVGGHNFNTEYVNKNYNQFLEEPEFIDPLYGVEALDPNIPATISEVLQLKGPTFTLGGACASGNLALRAGFRDIVSGECDRSIVTGGMYAMDNSDIHAMVFLQSVVVNPEYQDNPAASSRPFDTKRCGFLPSHGTATLVIEDLETAKRRGAHIYAEVVGVMANSNASHLPAPSSEEQGQLIKHLLEVTGVKPEQIDYVNCHATATHLGDLEEVRALKFALKDHVKNIKINAPKSMLGHTCWAAPLVETIAGVLQMNEGKLHPSINIDEQDPEIDLDVCANKAVDHEVNYFLKNSFGFGGINCCSLIKKYEE